MDSQSDRIREFLLDHVGAHPRDISQRAAQEFGVTRQAINRHLKLLIKAGAIEAQGATNRRVYSLKSTIRRFAIPLEEHSEEDQVWPAPSSKTCRGTSESSGMMLSRKSSIMPSIIPAERLPL
ncbi:MAG: hypothetical protein U0800_26650 [Isosphaeraceae bacterium]